MSDIEIDSACRLTLDCEKIHIIANLQAENADLKSLMQDIRNATDSQMQKSLLDLRIENEKLKEEIARLTAVTGLCCNNQLTQKKIRQIKNKKLEIAVEKIIEYEVACKLKGVGYDLYVHDVLVEALVF